MSIGRMQYVMRHLCSLVLYCEKIPCDELSLYFISDKAMRKLHADYFNDPSPTDCITFPVDQIKDPIYTVLGDIFICPKTALTYAKKNHKDQHQELVLYLIHGLLHLAGYDDLSSAEKKIMRRKEAKYMRMFLNLEKAVDGHL